jgi:DNA-binding NarL/FixJ family response regulator
MTMVCAPADAPGGQFGYDALPEELRAGMRILIADDHPLYREAVITQIKRLYADAVVDEAATLDDAMQLAGKAAYDLFLFDFYMPGMSDGAIGRIVANYPKIPVAVISGSADAQDVQGAIRAGARGFVPKTATGEHFASAIQLLLAGGTSVPADILMAPAAGTDKDSGTPWKAMLTPRENEVLKGVARGISNKQIGRELNLAEVTIKLHMRSIFRKIGAKTRAEAAVIATKAGL